jgi:hypothetical protein
VTAWPSHCERCGKEGVETACSACWDDGRHLCGSCTAAWRACGCDAGCLCLATVKGLPELRREVEGAETGAA